MRQIPPDIAETVTAGSVLVLAPHPDDEVLGCGGLLTQLADAGAAVRVLFLTDGSGAREAVDDRAAYAARRRDEAAAVADVLGFAGVEHLAVADGSLGEHLDEAAAVLRRALLSQRPDLLLVPSPLDVSRDHRAAFAAVHRLLSPLRRRRPGGDAGDAASEGRSGDPLAELASGLRILVYEINRPAYPDLLVDVSGEMDRLERAMALYASQEERRGYWRACQGLRAYRALTLGPGNGVSEDGISQESPSDDADLPDERAPDPPSAAEGYRRLAVSDFTTRSLAQLVAELGGRADLHAVEEGPLISVVVRTKDRPDLLAQALASLAASTWRRAEVVLVNDGGEPPEVPADFPLPVVRVDLPENRGRAAAANAGVAAASGDYVCFLDDDDLVAPEHLETLAGLVAAADVAVAYTDAAVGVYALDPDPDRRDGEGGWRCVERRLPYSRDFDPDRLLVDNYIPFHTLIIERGLFERVAPPSGDAGGSEAGPAVADRGPFDPSLPFFEDWDFLIRLAAVAPFHHHPQVTCEYRHFRGGGHHVLGGSPRRRADFLEMKARVVGRRLASAGGPLDAERLARVVDDLRAEAVSAEEAAASARQEARAARDDAGAAQRRVGELTVETLRLEDRWHRARGEVASLEGERRGLDGEVGRLYTDEAALRHQVAEQEAHLGRTYAEIQRLEGLLDEMRDTRAWRLHSRLQRLKGGGGAPEGG